MGNAGLCSPPLTTKCSSDLRNAGVEDGEVEDEDGSEELLFLFEHGTRIHYWILDFLWSFENQKLLEKCPILTIAICIACVQKKVDVEGQPRSSVT
ncbi:hypothetical protein CUMW_079520, partial [Citrus unshiu]